MTLSVVASVEQRPLLFKGDGFSHTDITSVVLQPDERSATVRDQ